MTDETSKSTAYARQLEAATARLRLMKRPSDNGLPLPRRKFSETFSAMSLMMSHFLNNGKTTTWSDHE